MKKVVAEIPKINLVLVESLDSDKYYGVKMDVNKRGFISREPSMGNEDPEFIVLNPIGLTTGNCWCFFKHYNLQCLITQLINDDKEVFQFDKFKELMDWVDFSN
jgi:hypothetical protein